MRVYVELAKSQMKVDFTYSAWYWAGTIAAVLQLLIAYAFWHAVYREQTTIANISLTSMLTYIVIAKFLGNYISGSGDMLAKAIREGSIAIELMRPYHLLAKLVALDLGSKATVTVRVTIPLLILSYFGLHIRVPETLLAAFLFCGSAVVGIFIGTMMDLIVGIVAFWTVNVWGLRVLRDAVYLFFTGSLVPISLFPHWLQTVSSYLPFSSMVFVPVSIYTGILTGKSAGVAICMQCIWLLILYMLVRLTWTLAIRKVTINGG